MAHRVGGRMENNDEARRFAVVDSYIEVMGNETSVRSALLQVSAGRPASNSIC